MYIFVFLERNDMPRKQMEGVNDPDDWSPCSVPRFGGPPAMNEKLFTFTPGAPTRHK